MNLIDQMNEKFQQAELPFMAFEDDNSIFITGRGYCTKTNIHNIEQLEFPLQLISVIMDHNPQLVDDCTHFNENDIKTFSLLNGKDSHHLSINMNESVEILSHVEHTQGLEFVNDRVYHDVSTGVVYSKKIITNQYDAVQQLKDCLSLTNSKLDAQKIEINKMALDFNHNVGAPVQNSNVTKSLFSYPTYDGPIDVDKLNEWVTDQKLPFKYIDKYVSDTVKGIELRHNHGHVLSLYTAIDGQFDSDLVSDLNFFNQLYHIDAKYINNSFDTHERGILTRLNSHEVVEINHKGDGIVMATIYNDIDVSERSHTDNTFEGVSVWINPSSTIMTNLDNVKEDLNLVSQTSKDLSSKLNEYVTKITDNLLINELNLDDLKTIDQNIQL